MAEISTLPAYEINSFCRWVANATLSYFENPDVQERFKKWKQERDAQANLKERTDAI